MGFAGLLALLPFTTGITVIVNGRLDLALMFFAVVGAVFWVIRRLLWRPKPYRIVFGQSGINVGGQTFAYADTVTHGVLSYPPA